jgi:hypothetical protein
MSWDYTVYCKRPRLHREALDTVYQKLTAMYGGGSDEDEEDEEEEDDEDDGEAVYAFDGFTVRVFEDPAGCRVEVWSQDGFDDDATDDAVECMEALAEALGGSVDEDEWLARSAAIDAKAAKKRTQKEPWLSVKGQPRTSRCLLYDEGGTLLTKKILTADALFASKPESRILTDEGRKELHVRKMEVVTHDGFGNPNRRIVLDYDEEGVEVARDDSGYVPR